MTRRIKLEIPLRPDVPAADQIPRVGEPFAGGIVVCSFPEIGDPNIIVETDADDALITPLAVDFREEHSDYRPLWVVEQAVQPQVGDTYPDEAARAAGQFGAGVVIGHVDTGVDAGHGAFAGVTVRGDTRDDHGHGTHTASTCASRWGIASNAILEVRNALPGGRGSEAGIANAIRSVVDAGARVVNLSLGGSASSVIDAACRYAASKGAITVAAAGNDGGRQRQPGSPARAADVIVLACDRQRQYAEFTDGQFWPNPNRVSAYGVDIAAAQRGTRDGVLVASGTSMAAPHVTGLLACLLGAGLDRDAALQYLWAHREAPPAVGLARLLADYGAPPAEPPGPPPPARDAVGLVLVARDLVQHTVEDLDYLRYTHRAQLDPLLRALVPPQHYPRLEELYTVLGEVARRNAEELAPALAALLAQLQAAPAPPPDPAPPPAPAPSEDWAHLHGGAPGLVGQQKWLPGSTGIDVFVRRGTPVYAPFAGTWRWQQVPGGPAPIGEGLLVRQDGFCARFRHVARRAADGPVAPGALLAVVHDPGLDLLRWPPGYPPPPDGYQHNDLSLATAPERLDPRGGAGGDIPAFAYIWERGGIANTQVIARTPGPPEGLRPFGDAAAVAAWAAWCGWPAAAVEALAWAAQARAA